MVSSPIFAEGLTSKGWPSGDGSTQATFPEAKPPEPMSSLLWSASAVSDSSKLSTMRCASVSKETDTDVACDASSSTGDGLLCGDDLRAYEMSSGSIMVDFKVAW